MGRKLTVLWDEREVGNSVMLLLASVFVAVLPNVPYRLNAPLGVLFIYKLNSYTNYLANRQRNINWYDLPRRCVS